MNPAELIAQIDLLKAQVGELQACLSGKDKEIAGLKHAIDQLSRRLFGRSAEKVNPDQMFFAALAELEVKEAEPVAVPPAESVPDDEDTREARKQRRRGHGRRRLPPDLPVRETHIYPEAETCCGEPMVEIGVEVSDQLEFTPASFHINRKVSHKRACAVRNHNVVRPTPPPSPIEKGLPGPGLIAQVLTAKYADHLPLTRLSGIFARSNVEIDKSTMCGWVAESAFMLKPIVRELGRQILRSFVVGLDDTGILVIEGAKPAGTHKGHLWCYHGDQGDVVFEYTRTRSGDGPAAFLRDYRGYVQADAFSGHNQLFETGTRVWVGCAAHARRKFFEARNTSAVPATWALAVFRRLYIFEDEARDMTPEARCAHRRAKAKPLLDAFKVWLDEMATTMLPKSPIGDAVGYARNQWPALIRYLEDGRLFIDNNRVERDIRGVAVGRNNWLFAGSHDGAERAATIYSLVQSCKLANVDPFAYFRDVLVRVSTTAQADVFDLTPRGWKAARARERAAADLGAASR